MGESLDFMAARMIEAWEPFRPMWPAYWMRVLLYRAQDEWLVEYLHLEGRFSVEPPIRHSTVVTRENWIIRSGIIAPDTFEELLRGLATGRPMVSGFPHGLRIRSGDTSSNTTVFLSWPTKQRHIDGRTGQDSSFTVALMEWNSGTALTSSFPGLATHDALNSEAQLMGYDSLNDLTFAQLGTSWEPAHSARVTVALPLALEVDMTRIDAGRCTVRLREPLDPMQICLYVSPDGRWSDDLTALGLSDHPSTSSHEGWTTFDLRIPRDQLSEGSYAWIQYRGKPCVPRSLRKPLSVTRREELTRINEFIYKGYDGFQKQLRAEREKLEVALLNALAGLGLSVFFTGDRGPQKDGVDLVAVSPDVKKVAVVSVTSGHYANTIPEKRPGVVASASAIKSRLSEGWKVYPVLAVRVERSKVDAVHWSDMRRAGVVLLTEEDLLELASREIAADDWWAKLEVGAPTDLRSRLMI